MIGLLAMQRFAYDGHVGYFASCFLLGSFFAYLLAMKLLIPFYPHEDGEHHFLTPAHGIDAAVSVDATVSPRVVAQLGNYGAVSATAADINDDEEQPVPSRSNGNSRTYDEPVLPVHVTTLKNLAEISEKIKKTVIPPFHLDESQLKERWMMVLGVSLFYITLLSEMCLFLSVKFSTMLGLKHHLTGLIVVALGAQIPDTFASMAVARQGEGPSALSNAIGSQVLNINLGIGLPFFISNVVRGVPVPVVEQNQVNSGLAVIVAVLVLLICAFANKMVLGKYSAMVLGLTYVGCVAFAFT